MYDSCGIISRGSHSSCHTGSGVLAGDTGEVPVLVVGFKSGTQSPYSEPTTQSSKPEFLGIRPNTVGRNPFESVPPNKRLTVLPLRTPRIPGSLYDQVTKTTST